MFAIADQDGHGVAAETYSQRMSRSPTRSPLFVSGGDHPHKEDAMKYMLLIHQGTTPMPRHPRLGRRSPRRSRARSTPPTRRSTRPRASRPACRWQPPETATTVRVQDGRTLTTDGPFVETKEALGGYLIFEADDLDAAIELAARIPAARMGGAIEVRPTRGVVATARPGLPRPVGPRPRGPDRLPRRLRPRRGGRAGGVRDRRRALAARRRCPPTRAPG